MRRVHLAFLLLPVLLCLRLTAHASPLFSATPLTDFAPGEKYLGVFSGKLYANGSNILATSSRHGMDGLYFADRVRPLDASGVSDSMRGKIVVVGLGMSNWTYELCVPVMVTDATVPPCTAASFFDQARGDPAVNNRFIVFVDCAANAQTAGKWINDSSGLYTRCSSILQANHVTKKQVQVILWKNADPDPTVSLSPSVDCSKALVPATSTPDACKYEHFVAEVARFVKTEYPNVQQMFLHSRIYGGYATTLLNPEPYAYEYGFATKWLIQAQIVQISGGLINANTGNLSYALAPWLAWGPYFWADGPNPRSDGLTWTRDDFSPDGTHPSQLGVAKVAQMMMRFYLNSPYSKWFVAPE